MLDRGNVDPVRIAAAPCASGRIAQRPHERKRAIDIAELHECKAERGPVWQHAQRRFGDHAERAFRSDEEIDQVHAGRGEVPRGQLRHGRHAISRHVDVKIAGVDLDRESSVRIGAKFRAP